jgi:hypothetical protein
VGVGVKGICLQGGSSPGKLGCQPLQLLLFCTASPPPTAICSVSDSNSKWDWACAKGVAMTDSTAAASVTAIMKFSSS